LISLEQFGLAINSTQITPTFRSYRPPSWPPPRDWVVIEDAQGNPVSCWGDSIWRLYPWAGKAVCLNFGDGSVTNTTSIDPENADLLRLLVTWRIWGPRGARTTSSLVNNFFTPMRKIISLCSREGILASNLTRFPAVMNQIAKELSPSSFGNVVVELHRLLDARQTLGFVLLDHHNLKRLAASRPEYNTEQTAYIPPRIWSYQVNRLRECLDDYLEHRQQVEDCFRFCLDAYAANYGSLTNALSTTTSTSKSPFMMSPYPDGGAQTGCIFYGHFAHTATRFGLSELFGRWVGLPNPQEMTKGIKLFTKYLSLVKNAGLAYLCNFSLMRIEESSLLRTDCLYVEHDAKFGPIPILCGNTTKTDPNSDARWPTSPSVQIAIDAMTSVARLRMGCAMNIPNVAPSIEDIANPFLYERSFEPWVGNKRLKQYSIRQHSRSYKSVINTFSLLFDEDALRITEEDIKVARLISPALDPEEFQVGKPWPFAWHQLRRTGAVNMFASGLISDSSMQYLMKHSSRAMPLYYGQGHSRLCLNEETRILVVNAMYEVMGKEILNVLSERFVSPYGAERKDMIIVNLISEPDAKLFAASARKGELFFRSIRIGGCLKRGTCSYGGVESVSHCAGGDNGHPCVDVLYDKEKTESNRKMLQSVTRQLAAAPYGSPHYRSLEAEKRALENYFDVINRN
jgi:hypothetical protein